MKPLLAVFPIHVFCFRKPETLDVGKKQSTQREGVPGKQELEQSHGNQLLRYHQPGRHFFRCFLMLGTVVSCLNLRGIVADKGLETGQEHTEHQYGEAKERDCFLNENDG